MKYSDLYYKLSKAYNLSGFWSIMHCPPHSSRHSDRYDEMIKILGDVGLQEMKSLKLYIESDVNGISNLLTVFGIELAFIIGILTILSEQTQSSSFISALVFFGIFAIIIILGIMIVAYKSNTRRNRNKYILLMINDLLNTRGIVAKNK